MFLITFNYLDSDVLPFSFRVEDGERRSQPYSREYDWLGPDLTLNTQGPYTLVLPEVFITLVTVWPSFKTNDCTLFGITLSASCVGVIII